jgi:uncharacterized membrane protein YeaQ/YmgE (transglycosylase-associated protein family)
VILLWLLIWGLAAGWIAHLLLRRHGPPEWGELLVAGVVGSFLGGLVASLLAGDGLDIQPSGLIGSVLGALVVLAIIDRVRWRRKTAASAAAHKAARSGRHQPR